MFLKPLEVDDDPHSEPETCGVNSKVTVNARQLIERNGIANILEN